MSFIIEGGVGTQDRVVRILLKQRLIKHYNDAAMQYLDKAIAQAGGLTKLRKLRSNRVSLELVK